MEISWGEINRFQRLSGAINLEYDDNLQSSPIGFDLHFGVLCPFLQVIIKKDTKKDTVTMEIVLFVQLNLALKKAKSLLAGGNSGDSKSKHFNDQACIEKEI
jgi:acyl-homoserine lactone acylase PvdQ